MKTVRQRGKLSQLRAPEPRSRNLFAGVALVLFTLTAYSNSFTSGFVLDNQLLILGDPRIRSATANNLALILQHSYWWPNGESGLYRPLTTLSYLLNYAVFGNSNHPGGYHWINFFLHLANVLLVFALVRRLLSREARAFGIAFFIALLWGVHPVLTESVTNIVGRADLMAGCAVLAGFWMYLKSAETSGWLQILWLVALALASAAGALSKESAAVLTGIIVLYELVRRSENAPPRPFPFARVLRGCAAALIPAAAVLWQRAVVLAGSPRAEFPFVDNPIAGATFWIGRLTSIKVMGNYLRIALWPVNLSADYSYAQIPLVSGNLSDWAAWILMAAVLSLVPLIYIWNRRAFFFVGFALLNFLPISNLVFPIGTIMAERLLYLPLIGGAAAVVIAIYAGQGFARLPDAVAPLLACLLAGASIAGTWMRNRDWQDDLTMATASVRTSPDSFKVHRLLAAVLFERDPAHSNIDRVVAEADRSVAILSALPDELQVPGPWNLAAACHLAKGDLLPDSDARRQYEEAARIAQRATAVEAANRAAYDHRHGVQSPVPPGAADGYRILASAYLRLRDGASALPPAMEARKINPGNVEVYGEIADAYLAEGRGEDAAVALAEGMFATSNSSLRENLLKLYQSGVDTQGCAVVPGPRGPALNPSCDIVHRDLCAGTAQAHRQDLWQQLQCRK